MAYNAGTLCLDWVGNHPEPAEGIHARFALFSQVLAEALGTLGMTAEVGEVPGEYCPGQYSVHDDNGHKLAGTAQRMTQGGWLFSAVIVVEERGVLRQVTEDVYEKLDLRWDPQTFGSVGHCVPGATVEKVRLSVLEVAARRWQLVAMDLPQAILAEAEQAHARHTVIIDRQPGAAARAPRLSH